MPVMIFGVSVPTPDDVINIFFPKPASSITDSSGAGSGGTVHDSTVTAPLPPGVVPSQNSSNSAPQQSQPSPPSGVAVGPEPTVSGRYVGQFETEIALDLIDSLQRPPPGVTSDYITILTNVSTWLGVKSPDVNMNNTNGAQPSWFSFAYPESILGFPSNVRAPSFTGNTLNSQESMRNEANKKRNDIYDVLNRVNSFVARAKNAGFVPPENPFALAMSFNVGRFGFSPVIIDGGVVTRIVNNIKSYLTLLAAESAGKLLLDQNSFKAAQLSSAGMSLDGFGGTGNTSVDLAKLLPDADAIKEQKAFESLAIFDFTKRIPKVLFTAFYAPDGVPKGTIIGWKKIPDASGYILRRKNIFDDREVTYTVSNEDVGLQTKRLREYVNAWVLTFYNNIQEEFVYSFLDADISPHGYFFYKVQAYQLQNHSPGAMFVVETQPIHLSIEQKGELRRQIEVLDPNNGPASQRTIRGSVDTVSPYPVLAHFLLGDSKYDWLLAAVNIRASINRGDSRTTTRNYSYLTSQLNFLFDQADAGKLVAPKNITTVLKNIEDSISKFGVNQVIKETLQETGALYHFEGKDPNDNALFSNVQTQNTKDSGLVSIVASAIDPETATLNLNTLASNLPQLISGQFVATSQNVSGAKFNPSSRHGLKNIKPQTVVIPKEFDQASDKAAEDEIQFLSKIDKLANGVVDLTTVEGLSVFMRVIRIFSDIGPGRGAAIAAVDVPEIPDPISPPLPPAPPPAPQQPVAAPAQPGDGGPTPRFIGDVEIT